MRQCPICKRGISEDEDIFLTKYSEGTKKLWQCAKCENMLLALNIPEEEEAYEKARRYFLDCATQRKNKTVLAYLNYILGIAGPQEKTPAPRKPETEPETKPARKTLPAVTPSSWVSIVRVIMWLSLLGFITIGYFVGASPYTGEHSIETILLFTVIGVCAVGGMMVFLEMADDLHKLAHRIDLVAYEQDALLKEIRELRRELEDDRDS